MPGLAGRPGGCQAHFAVQVRPRSDGRPGQDASHARCQHTYRSHHLAARSQQLTRVNLVGPFDGHRVRGNWVST